MYITHKNTSIRPSTREHVLASSSIQPCSFSREAQHDFHEAIIVDLDPPVAIRVVTFERLGDLLDDNTCAHEAVERDARGWIPGIRHGRRVLVLDEFDKARCEAIPAKW